MSTISGSDVIYFQPAYNDPPPHVYVNPPEFAECVCQANEKRFGYEPFKKLFCPRHGLESYHSGIFHRKSRTKGQYSRRGRFLHRQPPINCANGFIISFENQEELFLRPRNVDLFFSRRWENQLYKIVLTVRYLEAYKMEIFGDTVHPTRANYFEIVQTPLDLKNKLDWVPLGPMSNSKYIVKQWHDGNGWIFYMTMQLPSFEPFRKKRPLNSLFKISDRYATPNPPVRTPHMEVTFLGINNPWYYSKAVPGTKRKPRYPTTAQVRTNDLTAKTLAQFTTHTLRHPPGPLSTNCHWDFKKCSGAHYVRTEPGHDYKELSPACVTADEFAENMLRGQPMFNTYFYECFMPDEDLRTYTLSRMSLGFYNSYLKFLLKLPRNPKAIDVMIRPNQETDQGKKLDTKTQGSNQASEPDKLLPAPGLGNSESEQDVVPSKGASLPLTALDSDEEDNVSQKSGLSWTTLTASEPEQDDSCSEKSWHSDMSLPASEPEQEDEPSKSTSELDMGKESADDPAANAG